MGGCIRVAVAVSAALLAACAGRDFARPGADALQLGRTTHAELIQRYGDPRETGSQLANNRQIRLISYSYATQLDEPLESGTVPSRVMAYYLADDVLVGHQFLSSFKSDHTNFDESRVAAIEKGKASRADVIRLLGNPSGFAIPPLARAGASGWIRYYYQHMRPQPFSGPKFYRKTLTVTLDEKDVVSEVELVTFGEK